VNTHVRSNKPNPFLIAILCGNSVPSELLKILTCPFSASSDFVSCQICCCPLRRCCSVLQCVAVCITRSINGRIVAAPCSAVAVCDSALKCVALRDSVLQCVAVCCSVLQCVAVGCSVLQCVAVCCSVLQCATVCCNVSQRVAVYITRSICVYILILSASRGATHRHIHYVYISIYIDLRIAIYMALFQVYMALFQVYMALFQVYMALLSTCMSILPSTACSITYSSFANINRSCADMYADM